MKVLVVGSGAREHALGWKIKQSGYLKEIFFAPGNAGTSLIGENVSIEPDDIEEIASWAFKHEIDLTVVGPENPLMLGIAGEFSRKNLLLFGPCRSGALLEGSKDFAKKFMNKYGIPTAKSRLFYFFEEALHHVEQKTFPLVVKADGLAQGKGVVVCFSAQEAAEALRSFMVDRTLGKAGEKVLIEDFLEGEEISAFAILDGNRFCYIGEAKDYKRAYELNKGPNTGGMGSISSSSLISRDLRERICREVFEPAVDGLLDEGVSYKGILYAGLILTGEGPKVLEFNVRLGDPETQVLLPLVEDDLLLLFLSAAKGNLPRERVRLKQESSVGVVIAAKGYPGKYEKKLALPDLSSFPEDTLLFHASTSLDDGKFSNKGGRTLTAVACSDSIEKAREKVYEALNRFSWDGFFYRKDIGADSAASTAEQTRF